ncbi:MAG TPA: glycoside hydrolase family 3 N-terminal domain-containing protein [Pyrinomonadaceae bacterium]|jgi:beta-N-acetylhexosaminidase|nr:glycoside hydrolase family 3 N-terminal domain-containing protein [Pyrinomonadaceae bacterium]
MKPRPANNIRRECALVLLTAILIAGVFQPGTQSAARGKKSSAVKPYSSKPTKEALQWADKELRRMSLDEKIGQLVSVGINATFLNQDSEAFKALRHQVEDNHVGGIILFRGPVYESVVLVNRMQSLARYPLLISSDLEAGAGMRFDDTVNLPWNMAVGATDNPDYARRQGALTARESRALGVQQIYAPVADVNNNAANPVINVRSYGEDPAAVGRFVAAFVEGAQNNGVISTAKHFPGHGDTATDSHRGLPEINVSRDRLNAVELVPFRAAVKAGVGSVMTGHIGMPQIDPTVVVPLPRDVKLKPIDTDESSEVVMEKGTMPTTLSPVMNGMLRHDLGFDGLIVTDAMSMSGLTLYFTQEEASVRALEAGADLLLKPADPDAAIRGVKEAVSKGRLKEQRIDESARRVLAAKFDLGLVSQRITPLEEIDMNVAGQEAVKLASEIAEHAITLVRNDDKLVPQRSLRPDARIFNLAITNGDDRLWIANTFSQRIGLFSLPGDVGERRKVETVVLDDRSTDAEVQKALERAKGADLIVASLYGRVRTGQARSVGLPDAGAKALSGLISSKTPFVAISFGNPYLLQSFPELRTYMVAYGDMPSLQQAAARALLGETDITGKLPISLPGLYPRGAGIQLKRFER